MYSSKIFHVNFNSNYSSIVECSSSQMQIYVFFNIYQNCSSVEYWIEFIVYHLRESRVSNIFHRVILVDTEIQIQKFRQNMLSFKVYKSSYAKSIRPVPPLKISIWTPMLYNKGQIYIYRKRSMLSNRNSKISIIQFDHSNIHKSILVERKRRECSLFNAFHLQEHSTSMVQD